MRILALAVVFGLFLGGTAVADAVPANAPTVKLRDPGVAPRKALRFTAKKGMKRTLTMTMTMAMAMSMGANAMPPTNIPPIRMTVDMKVADVMASGDIKYTFELRRPRIVADKSTPKAMVDAMDEAVKSMTGLTGYAVVTSRGFTKEADVTVPPGATAQTRQLVDNLRQSMAQIAAPVPEEPVGRGAKWETIARMDQSGLALDQTATNEVVELKGDRVKLKISIAQSAKPQTIKSNGVSVDVTAYAATGSGETTLELAKLVPSQAEITMKSSMKMESMGQQMGMTLDVSMKMTGK